MTGRLLTHTVHLMRLPAFPHPFNAGMSFWEEFGILYQKPLEFGFPSGQPLTALLEKERLERVLVNVQCERRVH